MEKRRNEWIMHVWGKRRHSLELTDVEKFHIDMLKMYQEEQKKFDRILVNIAMDDYEDLALFEFLKSEISKALTGNNVEFKSCQNNPKLGEYVTFRPYVFDRIGEDVNIFYSHFKGYRSYFESRRKSYPMRVTDLCEMFWTYVMYKYSLNFDDAQEKLNNGKSIYCWFVLKNKISELDEKKDAYYISYINSIFNIEPEFKSYIGDYGKHSPGSFVWYNLKAMGEALKDKPLVTSIKEEDLASNLNATHFCEIYPMLFLSDDECYGVNDYTKVWNELNKNSLYTTLYPSKKIAKEYIGEFESYIIGNQII